MASEIVCARLPAPLVEAVDRIAQERKLPRSAIVEAALQSFAASAGEQDVDRAMRMDTVDTMLLLAAGPAINAALLHTLNQMVDFHARLSRLRESSQCGIAPRVSKSSELVESVNTVWQSILACCEISRIKQEHPMAFGSDSDEEK